MSTPKKKPAQKKDPSDNPLAEFLRAKQNRQQNQQFGAKGGKGGAPMKPRMWNRKNGM